MGIPLGYIYVYDMVVYVLCLSGGVCKCLMLS